MSKFKKKYHNCKIAKQVKQDLRERGYSHIWSENDFFWFKHYTRKMTSEAERIATITACFTKESADLSDYADYVF